MIRSRRVVHGWAMALGIAAAALQARADPPRPVIEALRLGTDDDRIRVSYRVAGAFNDEILERIHSGIRLSFEHKVVLLGHRMAPLFPRVTLARTIIVTTVRYDSLTQRYDVERRITGKSWPKSETPPSRVEQRSTTSRDEMESWMTVLQDVPLPRPSDARDNPVRIKVRTELGIRFLLMFLPWPNAATDEDWLQL